MQQYANDKKPWSEGGQEGEASPEAETLLAFGSLIEAANLPAF